MNIIEERNKIVDQLFLYTSDRSIQELHECLRDSIQEELV